MRDELLAWSVSSSLTRCSKCLRDFSLIEVQVQTIKCRCRSCEPRFTQFTHLSHGDGGIDRVGETKSRSHRLHSIRLQNQSSGSVITATPAHV